MKDDSFFEKKDTMNLNYYTLLAQIIQIFIKKMNLLFIKEVMEIKLLK